MFADKIFVISRKEKDKQNIKKSIKKCGGIIRDTIAKNVDYYVQSWMTDDEGKLGDCMDNNVEVIPFDYLLECIRRNTLLDFKKYSLGNMDGHDSDLFDILMEEKKLFVSPPCVDSIEYESIPQTYQEFMDYKWDKPNKKKCVIYLLPIISVKSKKSRNMKRIGARKRRKLNNSESQDMDSIHGNDMLEMIRNFIECYFQLKCEIKDSVELNVNKNVLIAGLKEFSVNVNDNDGVKQFDVCDIIDGILHVYSTNKYQKTGYCIVGFTDEDIFEDNSGFGILRGRAFGGSKVACFSMYNYIKILNNPSNNLDHIQNEKLSLLNTIAHEILHCFGLDHCVYYVCCMNAWCDIIHEYYNHVSSKLIKELKLNKNTLYSVASMHLCPIDLKKLHYLVDFDVKKRYHDLKYFHQKYRFNIQTKWYNNVLLKINI